MAYLITYSNGATKTVKDRPNVPPGGSVTRVSDAKLAVKPATIPAAPIKPQDHKEG